MAKADDVHRFQRFKAGRRTVAVRGRMVEDANGSGARSRRAESALKWRSVSLEADAALDGWATYIRSDGRPEDAQPGFSARRRTGGSEKM